jgi:hypothetical protein
MIRKAKNRLHHFLISSNKQSPHLVTFSHPQPMQSQFIHKLAIILIISFTVAPTGGCGSAADGNSSPSDINETTADGETVSRPSDTKGDLSGADGETTTDDPSVKIPEYYFISSGGGTANSSSFSARITVGPVHGSGKSTSNTYKARFIPVQR